MKAHRRASTGCAPQRSGLCISAENLLEGAGSQVTDSLDDVWEERESIHSSADEISDLRSILRCKYRSRSVSADTFREREARTQFCESSIQLAEFWLYVWVVEIPSVIGFFPVLIPSYAGALG